MKVALPQEPLREDRFFENGHGFHLHEACYGPAYPPKAVLLFVHGIGEDALLHEGLGQWLARHGVACRILDLQGFGRSEGPRGHIDHYEELLDDMRDWALYAREEAAGLPLYLGGHSYGSALAGLCAARLERERPGLLAGYLGCSAPFRLQEIVDRAIANANPWRKEKTTMVLGDIAAPSPTPAQQRRLVVSPKMREDIDPTVTLTFSKNFHRAVTAFGEIELLPPRVLVLIGEKDRIIGHDAPAKVRERLSHGHFAIRYYPERNHNLLLGSRAPEVYRDILGWMEAS